MLWQLSRLGLLVLVELASGCALVAALSGLTWRRPEGLGLGFAAGMGVNSVVMFALSAFGVGLSYKVALASLALIGLMAYGARLLLVRRGDESAQRQRAGRGHWIERLLAVVALMVLGVLVWRVLFDVMVSPYVLWDEYSFWGLAAKSIYSLRSVDLRGAVLGVSWRTPLLVPLGGASIGFALKTFAENYTRLASALYMVPAMLILYGMARRAALSALEGMLFLILFITAGRAFTFISIGLFSDLPFATLLLAGATIYLLAPKTQHVARTLVLAGIFFGMAAWSRAGGAYLVLGTIALVAIADFDTLRRTGGRPLIAMLTATCVLPLFWAIFLRLHPWPASTPPDTTLVSRVSLGQRLVSATPEMLRLATLRLDQWSGFWILAAISAAVSLMWFRRYRAPRILVAMISANVVFYWLAYMMIFPGDEALVAMSFERYIAHALPLGVLLVIFCYAALCARTSGVSPQDWAGSSAGDVDTNRRDVDSHQLAANPTS